VPGWVEVDQIEMSRILKEQGYIVDFAKKPATVGEAIEIQLKYTEDRRPVIAGLERVSRPGRRRYVDHKQVPRVHGGTGTAIVSTSVGVMPPLGTGFSLASRTSASSSATKGARSVGMGVCLYWRVRRLKRMTAATSMMAPKPARLSTGCRISLGLE